MRPAADVIEPLEHAPLDFALEHRGVAARRRGTLEGAPTCTGSRPNACAFIRIV